MKTIQSHKPKSTNRWIAFAFLSGVFCGLLSLVFSPESGWAHEYESWYASRRNYSLHESSIAGEPLPESSSGGYELEGKLGVLADALISAEFQASVDVWAEYE